MNYFFMDDFYWLRILKGFSVCDLKIFVFVVFVCLFSNLFLRKGKEKKEKKRKNKRKQKKNNEWHY